MVEQHCRYCTFECDDLIEMARHLFDQHDSQLPFRIRHGDPSNNSQVESPTEEPEQIEISSPDRTNGKETMIDLVSPVGSPSMISVIDLVSPVGSPSMISVIGQIPKSSSVRTAEKKKTKSIEKVAVKKKIIEEVAENKRKKKKKNIEIDLRSPVEVDLITPESSPTKTTSSNTASAKECGEKCNFKKKNPCRRLFFDVEDKEGRTTTLEGSHILLLS